MDAPRYIFLDTANYNHLVDDFYSRDRDVRARAERFIPRLLERGVVPTVSFFQMMEIASHGSFATVRRRFDLLSAIPCIAYVGTLMPDGGLGSVLDVLAVECRSVLDGVTDIDEIRKRVRARLFKASTGAHLFSAPSKELRVFHEMAVKNSLRSKYIESVSRSNIEQDIENTKISALINRGALKDYGERVRNVFRKQYDLGEYLSAHGDPKLSDPHGLAVQFYAPLRGMLDTSFETVADFVEYAAQLCGLDASEFDVGMTVDEFSRRAEFRNKLGVVAGLGTFSESDIPALAPGDIPSFNLYNNFRNFSHVPKRHDGSNLNDALMASMAPYFDVIVVDRRTHENLCETSDKMPDFNKYVGKFLKVPRYHDILRLI